MKESRIIAFIGIYGSLILASTFKNNYLAGIMILQAIIWVYRYCVLVKDNSKH